MDEKILFTDKQQTPNEPELQRAMGNFYEYFHELLHLCSDYVQTWKFPGKKYGWLIKVEKRSKALFWLTPLEDAYRIGFILREKERLTLLDSNLDSVIHQAVAEAVLYPEGYGLYFVVDDFSLHAQIVLFIQEIMRLRT